jgi:CheY-like chemotaxis protein/two-component sensor histidine kinase
MGIDLLEGSPGMGIVDRESIVAMKHAAIFMSDTLNDVLSMQKIEEGKLVLEMTPFCIAISTKNIVSIFQGALSAKNLNVTFQMDSNAPAKIVADRQRLEHTISNLLSNAIKFSLQGGVIVIVVKFERTVDHARNQLNLLLSVTDNGVGISNENQKMLFQNWVQIRPQFLQEGKGSGLGLTFCKEIVELHKGIITVTSAEGIGSTFSFKIPVEIMEDSTKNASKESEFTPKNAATLNVEITLGASRKLKVLVVDDAPTNRKMLSMLLRRDGIENDMAEDGQVAVNMAIKSIDYPDKEAGVIEYPYDLIFMDNLMPVMDGVAATTLLRNQGYPNLIVGLTGNVMEDDVVEYLNAGADGVLFKPLQSVTLKMLLEYVRNEGSLSLPGFYLQLGEHGVSRIPRAPRALKTDQ